MNEKSVSVQGGFSEYKKERMIKMSLTTSEMTPADIAAVCGNSGGNNGNNGSMWGNDWAWIIILLLFGYGGRGFGGGYGGGQGSGGSVVATVPCATQADVREAVDQQTLISKLDNQTYGLADSTYALNNSINSGFSGIQQTLCQGFNGINTGILQLGNSLDNSVSTLGYNFQNGINGISRQIADCCCDTRAAIKDVNTQSVFNTSAIQRQIADCCCDIEKANMQNRFDAQGYNCNTLQAIDKLGDRIIDYMASEKTQALRDENQALRLAASQSAQNAYLINQLKAPCPIPAYTVPNPNCCYNSCGCGA